MARILAEIAFCLGRILSFFCISFVARASAYLKLRVYSGYVSKKFASFGSHTNIDLGATIIGGRYITIGDNVHLGKNCVLSAWDSHGEQIFNPEIIISNKVQIGDYCHLSSINCISIGESALLGRWVTIVDNFHGEISNHDLNYSPIERPLHSKHGVEIGANVWIGDKVTILPGVRIGANSIIGANSVVTKEIPANSVAAGVPAKIIKYIG